VEQQDLVVAAVLSGNRNFEGRINPYVKANYLASPPLVVAYALAGKMDIDLYGEPLGRDPQGHPVFLKDIWPTHVEIQEAAVHATDRALFNKSYAEVCVGDANWNALQVPQGDTFAWEPDSTYVKNPPYFAGMARAPVTTDHISPAGSISQHSPAGKYLMSLGVQPKDFNSYGSRRGNHEVMMRGTFANIRLKNFLAPGTEGGVTLHLPGKTVTSIYDAAMQYQRDHVPLVVLAGKEYGAGSSRDWAAKGPCLLGVKAVIAESFERIHRSNLVGMGVLPLQFIPGESWKGLGISGEEVFYLEGIEHQLRPSQRLTVTTTGEKGKNSFGVILRIDTPDEIEYYRHGGILQYVLRHLLEV
jgi:aconitate hydratase